MKGHEFMIVGKGKRLESLCLVLVGLRTSYIIPIFYMWPLISAKTLKKEAD